MCSSRAMGSSGSQSLSASSGSCPERLRLLASFALTTRGRHAMPVGVELLFTNATLDQYDQMLEKLGMTPGGAGPPGLLFHWIGMTDEGMRAVDVWETKEQFEQYAQERIGPYAAETGIAGPPTRSFSAVHTYLSAG